MQPGPDFVVIGAARSGTTALCQYLEQHPQLAITEPKEPHYFAFAGQRPDFRGPGDAESINRKAVTDRAAYQRLFREDGRRWGEASVSYLYYPHAALALHEARPEVKLICLLRHPAERAFSAFSFMRTRLLEPCADFEEALAAEPGRIAGGWHHIWHYRRMGFYHAQLQPYFDLFGPARIRVYLHEELEGTPDDVLRDCFAFLGVEPGFQPSVRPRPHRSGRPRHAGLSRWLTRENGLKTALKAVLPVGFRRRLKEAVMRANVERTPARQETLERLARGYCEDIAGLESLLGRPTNWR